jgi:hypothetical protein
MLTCSQTAGVRAMLNRLLPGLLIAAFLAGCLPEKPAAQPQSWSYADLLALNTQTAPQPSHDLVALYARTHGRELQIRLDLLDYTSELDYDLYLALNSGPGGSRALPIDGEAGLDWNVLIRAPAGGIMSASDPDGKPLPGLKLRIWRDPGLDTVVISLNRDTLGKPAGGIGLEVYLTPAGSDLIVDRIGPAHSGSWSAERIPRVQVLLAFWNTFPAATPAQAVRRWDSAHSGPDRERHGLRRLLEAVEASSLPVFLLDLKTPQNLSALDYSGDLDWVRSLVRRGLVVLPEALPLNGLPFSRPGWIDQQYLQVAASVSSEFGLPPTPFLYAARQRADIQAGSFQQSVLITHHAAAETGNDALTASDSPGLPVQNRIALERHNKMLNMVLPAGGPGQAAGRNTAGENRAAGGESRALLEFAWQAGKEGPALEVRYALVAAAAAAAARQPGDPVQILALGGSLPDTTWGEPKAASATLRYLASRPWIQIWGAQQLKILRTNSTGLPITLAGEDQAEDFKLYGPDGEQLGSGLSAAQVHEEVLKGLQDAPPGMLSDTAWQSYYALLTPTHLDTSELVRLRASYLGQIGHLLEASRWAADPRVYGPRSDCTQDLDWDGQAECILADSNFFGVFKIYGGFLSSAFAIREGSVHQLVGPSSQFSTGLSDASVWDSQRGAAGDPAQLRGSFSEVEAGFASPSWEPFNPSPSPGRLVFSAPDGSYRKTYRLEGLSLVVEYQTAPPLTIQVALAIDPWQRFHPGWSGTYLWGEVQNGRSWGTSEGIQVVVYTNGRAVYQAFNDDRDAALLPEDPNYNFSPGHFLPFPFGLVLIDGLGDLWIEINFSGEPN